MGKILNLQEGHPVEVHKGLRSLILRVIQDLSSNKSFHCYEIKPGVQFNSRDFYFREPEILQEIFELYRNNHENEEKVHGTIHQSNEIQPVKACKNFIDELNKNIHYHMMLGTNNLTVHLPVDKKNRIMEIREILSSNSFLEILSDAIRRNPHISIDFENNHHGSFFGNLDNCITLFETLKDRYNEIGEKEKYNHINICFDSGHFFIDSEKMGYNKRRMLESFFEKMRDKIQTLHLHTNDSKSDRHLLFGFPIESLSINPPLNHEKVHENTSLILDLLPLLNLKEENNWNLVTETDTPYRYEDLYNNYFLIFDKIKQAM